MSETFNIGDVVKLKSGGPRMTVSGVDNIEGKQAVWCDWFEENQKKSGVFHPGTLELA